MRLGIPRVIYLEMQLKGDVDPDDLGLEELEEEEFEEI